MLSGTCTTSGLLLLSEMIAPSAGAGALNVIVPSDTLPLTRVEGLRLREEILRRLASAIGRIPVVSIAQMHNRTDIRALKHEFLLVKKESPLISKIIYQKGL